VQKLRISGGIVLLHVFMAWCFVKHGDNSSFTLAKDIGYSPMVGWIFRYFMTLFHKLSLRSVDGVIIISAVEVI
jgi:hypothetical protein